MPKGVFKAGDTEKRVHVILPASSVQRIGRLKDKTSAASATEVLRAALLTHEVVVDHLSQGWKFYVGRPGEDNFNKIEFVLDT